MSLTITPGVLDVTGPEAAKFLHAIVSSDVAALGVGESQASLLLTPAGKIVSTMWITRSADETYLIIVEREKVVEVEQCLSRLLIRTKAVIENVTENYVAQIDDVFGAPVLIDRTEDDDSALYNELRISHGIVSSINDVSEAIPQEAHLEKDAVSFSKGCYLGQELVCRIDSREATTPFSFFAVRGGVEISDEMGVVTSARETQDETIGGITCGPYTKIVRVPRKAAKDMQGSDVQPVSGYFSS